MNELMTTQTKHTAGPWQVKQGTNGFCKTWQVAFESPDNAQTIADCGAIVNEVYAGDTEHYVGAKVNTNHEANARLIAAAPELLEACQAVADCDANEEDWGKLEWLEDVQHAIDQARAALAKARGEQS